MEIFENELVVSQKPLSLSESEMGDGTPHLIA